MKTTARMEAYLAPNEWVESSHLDVQRVARGFDSPEAAYFFVRDTVHHSYDIRAMEVTATASQVLAAGHGICYAKAHLLAAILRAMGIPSGLAYQRLVLFDDPKDGYCLHAINTVYLAEVQRWIRLDARGNKPGVDAQYSIDKEMLAFPVLPELGEVDYPWNFDTPPTPIREFYNLQGNISDLYTRCLPGVLEINDDTNS